MIKHIGFTGTQAGMTEHQYDNVLEFFRQMRRDGVEFILHHGDCVGADSQSHVLANITGAKEIVIHPPSDPQKRAWASLVWPRAVPVTILEPKPYLVRNHDIVDACRILIATPKEMEEQLRSGTWATVRYARKIGRETHVLFPRSGIISIASKTEGDLLR